MPRHDRLLGRSDDMIIFRGVNIYPGQICDVIQHYPELGGEYHIELTREGARDFMLLKLERGANVSAVETMPLADVLRRNCTRLFWPAPLWKSSIPASCRVPSANPSV